MKGTKTKVVNNGSACGWGMFTAFFGALLYFFHHAYGFEGFVLAILKAIVWPAFVIYHVLQSLNV